MEICLFFVFIQKFSTYSFVIPSPIVKNQPHRYKPTGLTTEKLLHSGNRFHNLGHTILCAGKFRPLIGNDLFRRFGGEFDIIQLSGDNIDIFLAGFLFLMESGQFLSLSISSPSGR